jgi:hypothetical protein
VDNPKVRTVRLEDFAIVADGMRESDREEVWASHNHSPYEALRYSFDGSHYAKVLADCRDIPYCMFGVAAITPFSPVGSPWMLATDTINEHKKEFLRWSLVYADKIRNMHSKLENYVHAKNILSIDWLQWCGFTIEEPAPYGKENDLFRKFWMGVKHV